MLDTVFPSAISVLTLSGIGMFFGIVLSIAKLKLNVEKDPRIGLIAELLPGTNCGSCGFPGCAAYAAKIVLKGYPPNLCPGSSDEATAKIAAIMGTEANSARVRSIAGVRCHGGLDNTVNRFVYSGPQSCSAAGGLMEGPKLCGFGCIGFGDCVRICPFDAMSMGENGLPVVDKNKCTGCNKCVIACPRSVIALIPKEIEPLVMCLNKEKAPVMKKGCSVGCIGCRLCEKNCPEGAITVTDFCASIDYSKCTSCMKCVEVCPVPVIHPIEKSKKLLKQNEKPAEHRQSFQS